MIFSKIPLDEHTIRRFNATERLLHWLNAVFYLVLLITGLAFCFPVFSPLSLGHPVVNYIIHVGIGVSLGTWMILLYFFKLKKLPRSEWKQHFSYFKSNKYNAGQKMNISVTAFLMVVFFISGICMALGQYLPLSMLKAAFYIHNLAVMAILPIIFGHIFLSLVFPATNRSLFAMIIGKVEEQYARHHHPEWHKEVTEHLRTKPDLNEKKTH